MTALETHDCMTPRIARVMRRRKEIGDVATLWLDMEDGEPFAFGPGQFNMLTAFGVGEAAISISGDPDESSSLMHTIRAVGAVSRALAEMREGDVIGVRGPFGSVWPVDDAVKGKDVVIVAGGLGLAPLRPAICRLAADRDRFGRIALLYGARNPDEILFPEELDLWRDNNAIAAHVTVDVAPRDWTGNVGLVTKLIPLAGINPANTLALLCGPEIMMRFAGDELIDAGVPETAIHVSMERNMKCAVGLCGHCQFGSVFICRDGPVFDYASIGRFMRVKEL